jgi:hypothetical protein
VSAASVVSVAPLWARPRFKVVRVPSRVEGRVPSVIALLDIQDATVTAYVEAMVKAGTAIKDIVDYIRKNFGDKPVVSRITGPPPTAPPIVQTITTARPPAVSLLPASRQVQTRQVTAASGVTAPTMDRLWPIRPLVAHARRRQSHERKSSSSMPLLAISSTGCHSPGGSLFRKSKGVVTDPLAKHQPNFP